jgi:hypothetical protein
MSNALLEARRAAAADPVLAQAAQESMDALLSRSATDFEFRGRLLSDPRAAIREFTGRDVPESFEVDFVENRGTATIVLPDVVDPAAELSETELETVAGGTSDPFGVVLTIAGVVTTVLMVANAMDDHNKEQCQ